MLASTWIARFGTKLQSNVGLRLAIVLGMAFGFVFFRIVIDPTPNRHPFMIFPILASAALFGLSGGVFAWAVSFPLSHWICRLNGATTTSFIDEIDTSRALTGLVITSIVGYCSERISALSARIAEEHRREVEHRRRAAEAADMAARVTAAQENERRHIARELHDELGPSISSVLLSLRAFEERLPDHTLRLQARSIRDQLRRILVDVGVLARGLHPSVLESLGLEAALEQYARECRTRTGLEMQLVVHGAIPDDRVPEPVQLAIYRIVQEAVSNAARHSGAKEASVIIERGLHGIRAIIEDDGRGFDPAQVPVRGLGLCSMRERAQLLGGTVAVESAPGRGTAVRAHIPFSPRDLAPASEGARTT